MVILFLYYRTKNDYIYLALLFFIISIPGELFYNRTEDIVKISILEISFAEMFTVTAFFKHFQMMRGQVRFPFKKAYSLYFTFILILIIYGFLFGMGLSGTWGTGLGAYRRIAKMIILYSLFLTIPVMIDQEWKMVKFVQLIFTFVLFNLILQIINVLYGVNFNQYLGGEKVGMIFDIRPTYGTYLSFIAFVMSIYFLNTGILNKKYLFIIMIASSLSIVVTATRGWMVSIFFIFILIFISNYKFNIYRYFKTIIPLALLFLLAYQFTIINKQLFYSYNRFLTLELILSGDLTAGGTSSRLTTRSVPVMNMFYQRPFIGWGFTTKAFESYDVHIGNQSMLMSGGVIGYIIFMLTISSIIYVIMKSKKKYGFNLVKAKYLYIFIIAIGGLFIIHSSSTDLFSYMAPTYGDQVYKIVFLAIFFSIVTTIINNLYNENEAKRIS